MLIGLRSRKHIPSFELLRPESLDEACRACSEPGHVAVMAGGLDLIDRLKTGARVDRIVDLGAIGELSGIRREGDVISVGALTTHAGLAGSTLLAEWLPELAAIWRGIANPRIRHAGTVGGNLMAAMPHYDAAPAFMALGAEAVVVERSGIRSTLDLSALRERTDLILAHLRIPVAPFRRRLLADRSLHPIVSVYLGASVENGTLRSARIVAGCAHAQAMAVDLPVAGWPLAALATSGGDLAREAVGPMPEAIADGLASGAYRRRMIEVLARRLLVKLGSQS